MAVGLEDDPYSLQAQQIYAQLLILPRLSTVLSEKV